MAKYSKRKIINLQHENYKFGRIDQTHIREETTTSTIIRSQFRSPTSEQLAQLGNALAECDGLLDEKTRERLRFYTKGFEQRLRSDELLR